MRRRTALAILIALLLQATVLVHAELDAEWRLQHCPYLSNWTYGYNMAQCRAATSTFRFAYNPAFIPPAEPTAIPGLLVRVQNPEGTDAVGPSKMAWSSMTLGPDSLDLSPINASSVAFEPTAPYEVRGTEDPRVVLLSNGTYLMFYTAVGQNQPSTGRTIARLALAATETPMDLKSWRRHGPLFPDVNGFQFTKSGALLVAEQKPGSSEGKPSYLIFGDCSLYQGLQVAKVSPDFTSYSVLEDELLIEKRPGMFDSALVESGPPPVRLSNGNWLFVYNGAQPFAGVPNGLFYSPGFVILNGSNPLQVLFRSQRPIVRPEMYWETTGLTPYVIFVNGMGPPIVRLTVTPSCDQFALYYGGADTSVGVLHFEVCFSDDFTYDTQVHHL